MTDPPAAPGPPGGHDATQAFPAGGAPPPPPVPPPPAAPAGPSPWTSGPDPTQHQPDRVGQTHSVQAGDGRGWAPDHGAAPTAGYPAGPTGGGPVPPATPGAAGRRRGKGRIVGRALLVLIVIGALAGTTAWGFVNRSSAEEWRDRSRAADAALEESLDRVEVTSSDLEDARTRLRDLANEKAGETDRNRILSEIVAQAPEVTDALADCQQETTDLANDIIAAFGDPAADVAGLQARTGDVNEICEAALEQAEALEATIEDLGI